LVLTRIGAATFAYVAGYPAVENPAGATSARSAAPAPASARPTLHLLQSA
jgi:hypothetical protein